MALTEMALELSTLAPAFVTAPLPALKGVVPPIAGGPVLGQRSRQNLYEKDGCISGCYSLGQQASELLVGVIVVLRSAAG